jgi:hypothetical protein
MINQMKVLGSIANASVAKAACGCDSVIDRLNKKKAGMVNVDIAAGRYCSKVKIGR